ncbi:MAG: type II toxin-antitoxin system HigB family toxin [Tepidisphaeraceae bacterium]
MQVRSVGRLDEFVRKHGDAASWLRSWLAASLKAEWLNLQDVRKTFPHADGVKVKSGRTVTVFNVRGNKHRLIVTIDYPTGVVNVLTVLTHAEYDKEKWKETL